MSRGATLAVRRPGAAVPATRQAAGVPSARSQSVPVTLARPRRWGDAGPQGQKSGAPGRQDSNQDQQSAIRISGQRQRQRTAAANSRRIRVRRLWVVPEEGFEPSLSCPRRILSPLRLPFRHSGVPLILTFIAPPVKPQRPFPSHASRPAVSSSFACAASSTGGNGKSSSSFVGMRWM